MAVADEIERLQGAKADLKTSINAKNDEQHQITDETIDEYADFVDSIPTAEINDCSYLFSYNHRLNQMSDILSLCKNVTDMSYMFRNSTQLTSLNLNNLDTSNVTNMDRMFYYCNKLTSLDLSGLDTSKVTDMPSMFAYCNKLTSLDVSGFNTNNVINMSNMFAYCNELTSLDVSGFNTSNVTNMANMFDNCRSLISLDLSNFDTSKVTTVQNMFSRCSNLESINISGFDMSNVTNKSLNGLVNSSHNLTTFIANGVNLSGVQTLNGMFNSENLSTDSLNQILSMLKTATSLITKTLKQIGLKEEQATTCTTLSDWAQLQALGWTTGY